MSGETPPTGSSRFQGMGKKYSGSNMSPGSNHSPNGGRGGHNRSRVLASKVSAPRPINLPSLRRENANSAEWSGTASTAPAVSSGGGWGNSPSMSPFSLPQKWDNNATENKPEWQQNSNTIASPEPQPSPVQSKPATAPDASPNSPPHPQASRVWGAVSNTSTPTTSGEFPTAAETAPPENDAVEKSPDSDKPQIEKSRGDEKRIVAEVEHLDWDEMVQEDLEKEPTLDFAEDETVLPSDRFTEDYDRSYPPQMHPVSDEAGQSPSFHRGHSRRDNAWGGAWGANNNNNNSNNNNSHQDWNGNPRSSSQERRPSGDRGAWGRREQSGNSERGRSGRFGNRRPSHDRKANFQPTVLQRPRRMSELSARSDRSREDPVEQHHFHQQTSPTVLPAVIETTSGRPTELTAAQREVMLSAAERAKKRRDEEEAEYQAARERARKKAEALAAMAESKPKPVKSEEKPRTDDSKSKKDHQHASSSTDTEKSQSKDATPVISIEKPSLEDGKSSDHEAAKTDDTKEQVEKAAATPEKDAKVGDVSLSSKSSTNSKTNTDKKPDFDTDDDNKEWDSFVEGIRDNKVTEKKVSSDSNASAWNAYATRLQVTSESRMNAAIDKYAADRNLDPTLFDDMRQRDREPLRLPRQRESGRRNNRERERDRRHNRDEGRKRNSATNRESTEEPAEQDVNYESWPTLGGGASADGEEKVPVARGKGSSKKRQQDKNVDENASGKTADRVEKEDASAEMFGKSKKLSEHKGSEKAPSADEASGVSKAAFIAEPTESSSEKPLFDAADVDGVTQESGIKQCHEDDELLPDMIEASESGSHISHSVPTPESEPLGRGHAFSAEAVFEHWTRAKRHDFLQKSRDSIFPEAIERLVEFKPANLTFRTVDDESGATSLHMRSPPSLRSQNPAHEDYLMDKQHVANALVGNPSLARHAYAASSYEGELSPQLMPPMTTAMSGRHNFPLLVYQVPYNNRAPYIPGSAAYGVSADSQQQGMYIPTSPVQQPLQHHQQQPVMGVYLLPPQQMLPPWPGMPVNINNQRRRH